MSKAFDAAMNTPVVQMDEDQYAWHATFENGSEKIFVADCFNVAAADAGRFASMNGREVVKLERLS